MLVIEMSSLQHINLTFSFGALYALYSVDYADCIGALTLVNASSSTILHHRSCFAIAG